MGWICCTHRRDNKHMHSYVPELSYKRPSCRMRKILRWIWNIYSLKLCTEFIWLMVVFSGKLFWMRQRIGMTIFDGVCFSMWKLFPRRYAVSLDEYFPTFIMIVVRPKGRGSVCPGPSVATQNDRSFRNTALRTSNLTRTSLHSVWHEWTERVVSCGRKFWGWHLPLHVAPLFVELYLPTLSERAVRQGRVSLMKLAS
jgi:hypothetical protein